MIRKEDCTETEPRVSIRDIRLLISDFMGYCSTFLLPQSSYHTVASRIAGFLEWRDSRTQPPAIANALELLLGHEAGSKKSKEIVRQYRIRKAEERLGGYRAWRRQDWKVDIELAGSRHLDAALAEGNGVLLWGTSFCGVVVVKIGCYRGGYPLVHLSGWSHKLPLPPTLLARRIIAPLRIHSETRYLDERVVMAESGSLEYMRVLRQRLSENKCIWIYGENPNPGRKPVSASLFGREYLIPTGAPSLAYSTGAALIPTHVQRLSSGQYRIIFDKPIERDAHTKKNDWVNGAGHQFAARLEREIRDHPADWGWWEGSWILEQLRNQ
jgi:lauroyl/myristoyl acyltransferase